jgi:glycerophosphoryl diester phosphodiesterase
VKSIFFASLAFFAALAVVALAAAFGARRATRSTEIASRAARSTIGPRAAPAPLARRPIVIGHRGACGYRPEHTLASYELAIELGADFIEPDLVMTKDGALVARHENEISETTDVAEKFPSRKSTKYVDGKAVSGWFTEDFSLAELKSLRARERLAFRGHSYDGLFEVPTLDEIMGLAERRSRELGRTIGVYPETKHPSYHRSVGLPLEPAIAKALAARGWTGRESPVILQSFELSSLRELRGLGIQARMVLLLDEPATRPYDFVLSGDARTSADLARPEDLREVARVADGIGPWKRMIVPAGADGRLLAPTTLIRDAHDAGLFVHPYTFRNEREFLAAEYEGDPQRE